MNNQNLRVLNINADWSNDKCDKYDYLISVFCGATAGFLDVFFVGAPGMSKAGKLTDAAADEMVKKFAKMMGWSPRVENKGNVGSAIGFLENKFKVNYDHSNTEVVGKAFSMSAKNHHYKSLGHSPDMIGFDIVNIG